MFYCSASLAGAFSGLLAFAISKMDGVGGLSGWRWIFILEGALTVLTGFVVFWALPNSPETSTWLTPRERQFIRFRLEQDSGTKEGRVNTNEKFEMKYLIRALTDWKLWFTVLIYWGSTHVHMPTNARPLLTGTLQHPELCVHLHRSPDHSQPGLQRCGSSAAHNSDIRLGNDLIVDLCKAGG